MTDALVREIALACPPARAFRAFTEHVDLWWPRGHRRERGARMAFEPGARGRLLQHLEDGSTWTMAEVSVWEPPERLCYRWFPGSPNAPTDVEISFHDASGGTLVRIVHTATDPAAQQIWPDKVALFTGGWEAVLGELAGWLAEKP